MKTMKTMKELRYQRDCVNTLMDNPTSWYDGKEASVTLWVDVDNRIIRTVDGVNMEVTDKKQLDAIQMMYFN